MAVALDAVGTLAFGPAVTTFDNSSLTIGSGANRALVAYVLRDTAPTGISIVWDPVGANQALTLIGTATSGIAVAELWGVLNPVSGNKILRASWTNSAEFKTTPVSWTGVNQSSNANAFKNFNSATGSSTGVALVITSAIGDFVMACAGSPGSQALGSHNLTEDFNDTQGSINCAGQHGSGSSSVNATWAFTVINPWVIVGCDIAQAIAQKTVTLNTLKNLAGTPLAGLTNLHWAWYDVTDMALASGVAAQGSTQTTDTSGNMVFTVTGSALNSGQYGSLLLHDSSFVSSALFSLPIN